MLSVPTTCPFCACGCGFYLLARDGEVIGVTPSENHPVAAGKICARGWSAHESPCWGERVLHPMIARDGVLETASWERALDHVAQRLGELLDRGKPVGVLGSARATNEENYLCGRLARVGLRTNHLDFCHRTLSGPLIAGVEDVTGIPYHSSSIAGVESGDAIVLVEGDLAKTHPRVASSVLTALDKGARLIVIGCVQTQVARLASCFLQTAPGSEGEAINELLKSTLRPDIEEGEPTPMGWEGYDSLRRDLEAVQVSDEARAAGEWIAEAHRAVFLIGPTGGRGCQLRRDAAALATLAAITGHLDKPGSGLLPLLGRSNAQGACDMGVAPDRLPGYERPGDSESRKRLEEVWGGTIPPDPGWDAEKMLESLSGLIVLADDPAAVLPMGRRVREAMERMSFLVVLDSFATPAIRAADVVLPIASFAETEGTVTNLEGRIQRLRPAMALPGEATDGWKALAELCTRFAAGGGWSSAADVFGEITRAVPSYAGAAPQLFNGGWGSALSAAPRPEKHALRATTTEELRSAQRSYLLAREGAFDWGEDPLVCFSPTLSRDSRSERKLFPNGFVAMNAEDADTLGVRAGWQVKLGSDHGEAVVPIQLRSGVQRGVLLVPYGFRDRLATVLAEDGIAAVSVERA